MGGEEVRKAKAVDAELPAQFPNEQGCALAQALRNRKKRARSVPQVDDWSNNSNATASSVDAAAMRCRKQPRVTEMTVAELRAFLKQRNLRQSGSKRELLSRAMAANAAEPSDTTPHQGHPHAPSDANATE